MFKNGVDLNKDSWYIKLLDLMWGVNYKNFNNLCPLFWTVMGSLLILPFWCIFTVTGLGKLLKSQIVTDTFQIGTKFILGFLFSVIISTTVVLMTMAIVYGIRYLSPDMLHFLAIIVGLLVFGTALIVTSIYLIDHMDISFNKSNKFTKVILFIPAAIIDFIKLVSGFIVSVYKKNCPLINWK